MTHAIVVGYGSIGRRHVRLLHDLGCSVAVVSRRDVEHTPIFPTLTRALAAMPTDYVVVANETSAHVAALEELVAVGFRGRVLIEKPLGGIGTMGDFAVASVAYNLRFHPVLAALADAVRNERIVALQIYCGQYLPDWRPGTDFRAGYSADPERGGGVLRDLSHELDYLLWLGGAWRRIAAIGGRFGALDIKSDDCWGLLVELERCDCATVQVNYLDRPGRRQVTAVTAHHTYAADLVQGTLSRDGETQKFAGVPDEMYIAQHRAMLVGDKLRLCSLQEGEQVMILIAAAERAARERVWVCA